MNRVDGGTLTGVRIVAVAASAGFGLGWLSSALSAALAAVLGGVLVLVAVWPVPGRAEPLRPLCRCERPGPDVIVDPVAGSPVRCGRCQGVLATGGL